MSRKGAQVGANVGVSPQEELATSRQQQEGRHGDLAAMEAALAARDTELAALQVYIHGPASRTYH